MSDSSNRFSLAGRIGYIDMKWTDTGKPRTTINIGVKKNKDEYDNFFITFFNNKNRNLAEELAEDVKKGDYIRVSGSLNVNKFQGKETIQCTGWGYKHVEFDKEAKKFVDVDKEEETKQTPKEEKDSEKPDEEYSDDDDIIFD